MCDKVIITSTSVAVWNIAISVFVRLLVCLSHISKNKCSNSIPTKFSVYVTCGRDSVRLWRQCNMLCTSGFYGWRRFHIMGPMSQNQRRRVSSSSPGSGTGGTSADSDCILYLKQFSLPLSPTYSIRLQWYQLNWHLLLALILIVK